MVSIIITTYNRKNIIAKSLNSVLGQTYKDLEIIIVDDASNDGTEEYVKQNFKDPRIKYFRLLVNNGCATPARNFGLEKISGEYFLVWDSDDVLYPKAIETLITIFKNNDDLAVVSAPARCLAGEKIVEFKRMPEGVIPKEVVIGRALATNHKVKIAKTSLCGKVRYQARNIDFLVNVQMAEKGKWYCHDEYLADVFLESDPNSLTIGRKKTDIRWSALRAPYLGEYLRKYRQLLIDKYPTKYAGFAYGASLGFFVAGEKKESRYFIIEALKNDFKIKYLLILPLYYFPLGKKIFSVAVKVKNNYFSTSNSQTKNLARIKK